MTQTVEASSLSAITEIASHPPAHPKATSDASIQPLVLYIARVPGSRDVFLTPLKPREKVVSAEDVQSSLYYVHINNAEDANILHVQPRRPSSVDTNAVDILNRQDSTLQRKPVPPRRSQRPGSPVSRPMPPYPIDGGSFVPERRPPSPLKNQVPRKPVLGNITNSIPQQQYPVLDLPEIPRRPLPPPPVEDTENIDHRDSSEHESATTHVGSLTLIRRDPTSSAQWNVASIHDPPVQEVSSATMLSPGAGGRAKKGGAPLYLDITNPGYCQFISTTRSESRTSTSTSSSDTAPLPEGTFHRRLYMPSSRHADHRYSTKGPDHLNVPNDMAVSQRTRHSIDRTPYPDLSAPIMDRRSKIYSFLSPWDGICEFITSTSGKALKCRHSMPNQQNTIEVSELRFNLPTKTPTASSTADKRSSYFSGLHRRLRSEDSWGGGPSPELPSHPLGSVDDDDEDRLDLSLGQEQAGGGFGGKQAKLGKLIVYPGGLAMLDLLVAANIGLWWRAWERV
jgi:hypothetical protein